MKKSLKYFIVFLILALIVFFIKNTIHQKLDKGVSIDNHKWETKFPKVFNNSGYSKLIESKEILEQFKNNPESLQELQGKITNEFGIRDDILEYILSLNLDENSSKALIKMSQYDNAMYYLSKNDKEANIWANKGALAMRCVFYFLNDKKSIKLIRETDLMMRNTKERNKYMWWIDTNYLGYHVIGTGLSMPEENKKCKESYY